MSKTKEAQAQQIAKLQRELREARAGQVHVYHFADAVLDKAATKYMTGSGIVVTMTALGGRELFEPVLIRDGLSDDLVAALRKDFVRSYELATMYKPRSLA